MLAETDCGLRLGVSGFMWIFNFNKSGKTQLIGYPSEVLEPCLAYSLLMSQ